MGAIRRIRRRPGPRQCPARAQETRRLCYRAGQFVCGSIWYGRVSLGVERLILLPSHSLCAVLKRLSLCEKLSIVPLYFLDKVCNTQFAQCFAVERVINQQGIEAQYEGFLEHCGRGIVRALRALNGPAALPALVHCAHGKDRTGVVCALVLKLCGASDEEVVADYVATQTNLAGDGRARMRQELASVRLDPSFEGARAATMQRFLHALHAKHGGVAVYLARNGFLLDEQISLRRTLVA